MAELQLYPDIVIIYMKNICVAKMTRFEKNVTVLAKSR